MYTMDLAISKNFQGSKRNGARIHFFNTIGANNP